MKKRDINNDIEATAGERESSIYTGTELTQVPIWDSIIIIIQFIIIVFVILDPVALMLLGDCAGAMETRPDVLFVVWNGFIFLDVSLMMNVGDKKKCIVRILHIIVNKHKSAVKASKRKILQ